MTQRYTQSGGVRPFGISTLICGFDHDGMGRIVLLFPSVAHVLNVLRSSGTPRLFQTDPAGTYSEWKACACYLCTHAF